MKTDLRIIKRELRAEIKEYRRALPGQVKSGFDRSILEKFLSCYPYRHSKTVLTYVSTAIEVDTIALIERVLADGKRVACPRCIEGTHEMEFYYIDSLKDLSPGAFGVLEPQPDKERMLTDYTTGVCIVPGLSFDSKGYRLGYGKGYYDRFLSAFSGFTVGICYSECVRWTLPHGRFDRPVELLLTEKYSRRCNK